MYTTKATESTTYRRLGPGPVCESGLLLRRHFRAPEASLAGCSWASDAVAAAGVSLVGASELGSLTGCVAPAVLGPATAAGAGALVAPLMGRHRGLGVAGGRVPVPP